MAKFALVELDTGEQEFFDSSYDAFKFAKKQEDSRRHSVEYVAIGDFWIEDGIVYRGQQLRYMLRLLDNLNAWIEESRRG